MKPFPFQHFGSSWLAGTDPYRFLGDEMGLGKSIQSILASWKVGDSTLGVVPASLRTNWQREIAKWVSCPVQVLRELKDNPQPYYPFTLCSYEYATKRADALRAMRFDTLIVDEAHQACRRDAQRSDALFGRGGDAGIARSVGRVWWLSGTPILTSPADLWLPFRFAGVTDMPYVTWEKKYCVLSSNGRDVRPVGLRQESADELRTLIRESSFVLRRLKEDVLSELPPKFYSHTYVDPELSPVEVCAMGEIGLDQVALEARLVAHAMHSHEFRTDELRVLQSLAQSCTTLRRYLSMQKVGPVVTLVSKELDAELYPKILIGFEYRVPLEAAATRLARYGVAVIHGDVPEWQRYAALDCFQTDSRCRVLLMQIRAGGVGVNATAADQVIVADCPWTPAVLHQFVDRTHRIGQTRAVTARVMTLSTEPLDQALVRLIVRRARDIKDVLGE